MAFSRYVLIAGMFAMWFGGFTFYSGIVIPTAHYVIREPMLFGFVTQRVTYWLNGFHVAFLLLASFDLLMRLQTQYQQNSDESSADDTETLPSRRLAWPTRIELGALCLGLIGVAGLYALHWQMDAMLDQGNKQVRDEAVDYFYPFHKGYLIVSTVLWFIGLVHFVMLTRAHHASVGNMPQVSADQNEPVSTLELAPEEVSGSSL